VAKATVTGLRKRLQLETAEEAGRLLVRRADRRDRGDSVAAAAEPVDVSAVERGLLHHRFLEHVTVARTDSAEALAMEVHRLVAERRFTTAEAAALDLVALLRFWRGPLGTQLRAGEGRLLRELPFTLRLDMPELLRLGFTPDPGLAPDEYLVVQGVIDLVWVGEGTAWILDFKTDRIPDGAVAGPAKVAAKAEDYRPQLALYAVAVERLLGRTVSAGWLHFLANGAEVEVLNRARNV
jgi:ATP-dependent helicase/nuclease subunit A